MLLQGSFAVLGDVSWYVLQAVDINTDLLSGSGRQLTQAATLGDAIGEAAMAATIARFKEEEAASSTRSGISNLFSAHTSLLSAAISLTCNTSDLMMHDDFRKLYGPLQPTLVDLKSTLHLEWCVLTSCC